MIKLGEKQELICIKKVDFGVYLASSEKDEEKVLLPAKQVPNGFGIGDKIKVFIYKDSKDRLIATVNEPGIMMGGVKKLKVLEVGKIGAFLDWGLEKDLLLPFKEQTYKVEEGDEVLVALYSDKSSRLCATMKVYKYLEKDSPYKKNDQVTGTLYEISDNFGAFVAVDDKYSALIPKKEMTKSLRCGQQINARVTSVKEDGKIDLSVKEKVQFQMSIDADKLVKRLEEEGGKLPFNDKASPERIREEMDMSKNEFKRAVGNLLKAGRIEILGNSIVLKK